MSLYEKNIFEYYYGRRIKVHFIKAGSFNHNNMFTRRKEAIDYTSKQHFCNVEGTYTSSCDINVLYFLQHIHLFLRER